MNILLCPLSDGGYLYPAIAAGLELRHRGHVVSALGRARAASVLAEAGLPFVPAEDLGELAGFSAARWWSTGMEQHRATLRAAALTRADVLLTSVLCHGALAAAEVLDIPVVVIGLSVHLWDYQAGGGGEPQGKIRGNRTRDMTAHYAALREQAGLRPRRYPRAQDPLLGAALLLRGVPGLEYPGALLPGRVHHVGPLAWEPAADPAEIDRLRQHLDRNGKPVVYVHLGRFFEGINQWPVLNAAFTAGPFQAVIERGRSRDPRPAPGADVLLVHKPWMGPLIDRAGLVLSSGTSAPVLASLLRGLPLGVSPNGAEQPLLAAACMRAGVAVRVPRTVTGDPGAVLRSAWRDRGLHDHARDFGRKLAAVDSAARAADVVEQVASGAGQDGKPGAAPAHGKTTHREGRAMSGEQGTGAPMLVRDCLRGLFAGAIRWLGCNLHFFDPLSSSSPLPENMRVKAALELAIFCHSWAKLKPATGVLGEATALLRTIWLRPEFPLLIDTHGDIWADSQRLAYAALAPAGVRDDLRESALARLRTSGYLSPLAKTPTLRLEIRYYADKARIEHGMESYQDLAAESLLARPPAPPVPRGVAYTITHTTFHLSDFGCLDADLPGDVRDRAERVTRSMIGSCARQGLWDLTGELVSALGCLGGDPLATPAGQAGIRSLALAQLDNGAIPGRSAANRAQPSLSSAEFFRKAYHTTLVAALMSMIVG